MLRCTYSRRGSILNYRDGWQHTCRNTKNPSSNPTKTPLPVPHQISLCFTQIGCLPTWPSMVRGTSSSYRVTTEVMEQQTETGRYQRPPARMPTYSTAHSEHLVGQQCLMAREVLQVQRVCFSLYRRGGPGRADQVRYCSRALQVLQNWTMSSWQSLPLLTFYGHIQVRNTL